MMITLRVQHGRQIQYNTIQFNSDDDRASARILEKVVQNNLIEEVEKHRGDDRFCKIPFASLDTGPPPTTI